MYILIRNNSLNRKSTHITPAHAGLGNRNVIRETDL